MRARDPARLAKARGKASVPARDSNGRASSKASVLVAKGVSVPAVREDSVPKGKASVPAGA